MKRIRRIIFWCHLSAGVIAGLVILVMSVTGAMLAFQPQIERFADRRVRALNPPEAEAQRLGAQTLYEKVREARRDVEPTALTLHRDQSEAAVFALGRESVLYVNPYTGEVLGEGSRGVRAFFRSVTDFHRWLGAQGENRAVARAITGVCNAAFLVLACSGIYLWWPKKWSRPNLASVTIFKRGLKGRARDFNWHNTAGFWCSVVLIFLTATGMVMSYRWANNLLYTLTGSALPPPARGPAERVVESNQARATLNGSVDNLDQLWTRAEEQVVPWQLITLRIPQRKGEPVVFSIRQSKAWNPLATSQLTLDPVTSEVANWEPYEGLSLGRRLRSWSRSIHTGEAGRLPG